MDLNIKLNRAKELLNLSYSEFKGVCLAIDEMKNKQKVNHSQTE